MFHCVFVQRHLTLGFIEQSVVYYSFIRFSLEGSISIQFHGRPIPNLSIQNVAVLNSRALKRDVLGDPTQSTAPVERETDVFNGSTRARRILYATLPSTTKSWRCILTCYTRLNTLNITPATITLNFER